MKMKQLVMMIVLSVSCIQATDSLKGIWSDIKKFPLFHSTFWKSFAQGFGASPSGYVYSFSVYNDMRSPVYFAINEIISLMGGNMPKPHGWFLYTVPSFRYHTIHNQSYYFELLIKSKDVGYPSRMPYLQHSDVLYRFEAIQLSGKKHSTKMHFYRAYVGKNLQDGQYVHVPAAEYLGDNDPAQTKSTTDDIVIDSTLNNLTIYNSTDVDYFIGFSNSLTQSNASLVYDLIPAHSFALLSSCAQFASLSPGMISLYDAATKSLLGSFTLPSKIFQNMPYTLEIYQDVGPKNQESVVQMDLQGLMSGNYDQPIGAVRDLTPVTCVMWYDTTKTITNNLPGKLWIVQNISEKASILASVAPGQAVQFNITRPLPNHKLWLYFVYVDTQDDKKAEQFLFNVFKKNHQDAIIDVYHQQSTEQMALINQLLNDKISKKIPKNILVQAAQGLLNLKNGQIQDEQTEITGYLLGGDVYLPLGVGAGPMYYYLAANDITESEYPMNTVQNKYASSAGSTKALVGMPTPILVS